MSGLGVELLASGHLHLRASLPVSGSPAVAVVLGHSKPCQNLALGA